jgi:hypothetical protein
MKGIKGLIIALGLGVAGAMFNWAYLAKKSRDVEKINFIGIASEATVGHGERLTEENLVPIGVPERNVGNLDNFAVRWSDRQTVLGMNVYRALTGGSMLLRQDLKTPPQELRFGHDPNVQERAMWIPVETRTFVPSLVVPGDMVSFLVSGTAAGTPTPADGSAPTEIIGPFKILSLGNRLGSVAVLRASKVSQVQENVMTIRVKIENSRLEPKARKLWKLLRATNFRQVGILLHPRGDEGMR